MSYDAVANGSGYDGWRPVIHDNGTRVSRRRFLKLGVTAAGATLAGGCRSSGLILSSGTEPDLSAQAQLNYRTSLAALRRSLPLSDGTEAPEVGTGTLASDPGLLRASRGARPGRADFDVLIIGSGYGGAVCAARLAARRRPGVRIGLLERGREWVPGTFPQHLLQFNPLNPFIRRTTVVDERATPPAIRSASTGSTTAMCRSSSAAAWAAPP